MHLNTTTGKDLFSKKEIFLAISLILAPVVEKADASECEILPDKNFSSQVRSCLKNNFGVVDESLHNIYLGNIYKNNSGMAVLHPERLSPKKIDKKRGKFGYKTRTNDLEKAYLQEGDMLLNIQEILNDPEKFSFFRDKFLEGQRISAEKSINQRSLKLSEQLLIPVPKTNFNRYEIIQYYLGVLENEKDNIQPNYKKIPKNVRFFLDKIVPGICVQESGCQQMLVSPAVAGSAWQILKRQGTAQYNKARSNFGEASRLGIRHLAIDSYNPNWKKMLQKWDLPENIEDEVIAMMTVNAYNSGNSRLTKILTKFGEKFPDKKSLKKLYPQNHKISAQDFFDNIRALGYLSVSGYGHDSSSYVSLIIEGAKTAQEIQKNKDKILEKFKGKISPINVRQKKAEWKEKGIRIFSSRGKYSNQYNGLEGTSMIGLKEEVFNGLPQLLKDLELENTHLVMVTGTENNRKDTLYESGTKFSDGMRISLATKISPQRISRTKKIRKRIRRRGKKTRYKTFRHRYFVNKTPKGLNPKNWGKIKNGGSELWESFENNPDVKILESGIMGKIIEIKGKIYEVNKREGKITIAFYSPDFYSKNKDKILKNIQGSRQVAQTLMQENNIKNNPESLSSAVDVTKIMSSHLTFTHPGKPLFVNPKIMEDFFSLIINFHRESGKKIIIDNNPNKKCNNISLQEQHISGVSFDLDRETSHRKDFIKMAKKYGFTFSSFSGENLSHSRYHFKYKNPENKMPQPLLASSQ